MALTQEQVEADICRYIDKMFYPSKPATATEKMIDELNMDSLDHVELVMEMESVFQISIPDDEAAQCETARDLARLICTK